MMSLHTRWSRTGAVSQETKRFKQLLFFRVRCFPCCTAQLIPLWDNEAGISSSQHDYTIIKLQFHSAEIFPTGL